MSLIPSHEENIQSSLRMSKPLRLFIFLSITAPFSFCCKGCQGAMSSPQLQPHTPSCTAQPPQGVTQPATSHSSCFPGWATALTSRTSRQIFVVLLFTRDLAELSPTESFTVESFSAGRASEERVLLAPHSTEMGTEKSHVLGCSTQICHNESLTKTITVSFQVKFFYYSLNVWKSCTYCTSNMILAKSSTPPPPTALLFAGIQADELLLHYSTTTDLFNVLCSLLSFHKSPLSSLEDTDIKSHDKALL